MFKAIIIGGSAGSFKITLNIIDSLPAGFPIPLIVCMHRMRSIKSGIVFALSGSAAIKICEPVDKEKIEAGKIYIAPANYHLLFEKDGFFSARVQLNLWKREAQNAGLFDQTTYDQYKHKLYIASIEQNRRCYDFFLLQGSFGNAEACLRIWKLHTKEIGLFDADAYVAMEQQLMRAKKKASQKKSRKEK